MPRPLRAGLFSLFCFCCALLGRERSRDCLYDEKERRRYVRVSVKEPVFPFKKFQNVDVLRGPEMKSTGEVMGIDNKFEIFFNEII